MAWPSTAGMPEPSRDSGRVAGSTITTTLTAIPTFTAAACWLLGLFVMNTTGVEITLTLANDAGEEFAAFIVPTGYSGPAPNTHGGIPFKPQVGLKWKVSATTAGFFAQAWGYQ